MQYNKINVTFNKDNTASPVVSPTNSLCNKNLISPIVDKLASDQLPINNDIVMTKGDNAASSHYWREENVKVLSKIKDIIGPSVLLPNKNTIDVTSQGNLPLSKLLSPRAKNVMILPGL